MFFSKIESIAIGNTSLIFIATINGIVTAVKWNYFTYSHFVSFYNLIRCSSTTNFKTFSLYLLLIITINVQLLTIIYGNNGAGRSGIKISC